MIALLVACATPLTEPSLVDTPAWLVGAPFETSLASDAAVLGVSPGLLSKNGHVSVDVDPASAGTGLVITKELVDRTGFIDEDGVRHQVRNVHGRWVFGELSAVQRYAEPGRKELDGVELIEGQHKAWVRPRRLLADLEGVPGVDTLWMDAGHLLQRIDQVAFGWDDTELRLRGTCPSGCTEQDAVDLRRFVASLRASVDCPESWRAPLRSLRIGRIDDVIVGVSR